MMEKTHLTKFLCLVLLVTWASCAVSTKKGLCVKSKEYLCDDMPLFTGISWWNDWCLEPCYLKWTDCSNAPTQERVPMVWGWGAKSNITGRIPNTSPYLLGFNEPNHKLQSNLTPLEAANAWSFVQEAAGDKILVTPSASPCGNPEKCHENTIEWFESFFNYCQGCNFTHMATHHYSCRPQHTMNYLTRLYERFQMPIWLTEFACPQTSNVTEILEYMKGVLPLLEAAPFVFRYSWFLSRRNVTKYVHPEVSLLQPNSSALSMIGQYYNDFQP